MDSYIGTLLSVLQSLEVRLSGLENDEKRVGSVRGDAYAKLVEVIRAYLDLRSSRRINYYELEFKYERDGSGVQIILPGNPYDKDPSIEVVYLGKFQRRVDIKYVTDDVETPYRVLVRGDYDKDDMYPLLRMPGEKPKPSFNTFWVETVKFGSVDEMFAWLDDFYGDDRPSHYIPDHA